MDLLCGSSFEDPKGIENEENRPTLLSFKQKEQPQGNSGITVSHQKLPIHTQTSGFTNVFGDENATPHSSVTVNRENTALRIIPFDQLDAEGMLTKPKMQIPESERKPELITSFTNRKLKVSQLGLQKRPSQPLSAAIPNKRKRLAVVSLSDMMQCVESLSR